MLQELVKLMRNEEKVISFGDFNAVPDGIAPLMNEVNISGIEGPAEVVITSSGGTKVFVRELILPAKVNFSGRNRPCFLRFIQSNNHNQACQQQHISSDRQAMLPEILWTVAP